MALRFREGRKSPWQVYWNNPITGKRESENFLAEHDAKKHDSLIKHRIKFDRESFAKEESSEEIKSSRPTLEQCYFEYLKRKQFSKKGLEWQLDAMREPLRKIGGLPVEEITRQHIEAIMKTMLSTSVKPVTVRGRMSVLRTVLRWSAEQGFCEPINFPRLPPAHYEKFVPPTPAELDAIIQNAPPHIVRVVILGAQIGMRVGPSELLRLTWDDVDLTRMVIRVHGAKKNLQSPWREVPIKEELRAEFEQWRQEDAASGCTMLIHFNGKPVSSIKRAWAESLRRAGITRRIRPYDLRHAFATYLIAEGVDIGTVAKLMGHNSPTMILAHYQHVMDTQKRSAVESLPTLVHVPKGMCPKKETPTVLQ